jgi:hypothetical protein
MDEPDRTVHQELMKVQDLGNIPGAHRHYVLSNPEDWFHYVDTFGQEGVKVFFESVSDRLVKWWCTLFHELEELEAANRDESVHLIKDLVDRRVTENPNGPLSDALASEWYTQTLAPAAKRHNAVLQVKKKKISQLTETWGVGWEAIIDPGMLVLKRDLSHDVWEIIGWEYLTRHMRPRRLKR